MEHLFFKNGEYPFVILVRMYIEFVSKRDEINLLAFEGCNFRQLVRLVFLAITIFTYFKRLL